MLILILVSIFNCPLIFCFLKIVIINVHTFSSFVYEIEISFKFWCVWDIKIGLFWVFGELSATWTSEHKVCVPEY